MKQRATEVLFKHKLLIILPVIVIVSLTIVAALRPKPQRWQSFAVVWIDQYQPLYRDERLGYTPAANQSGLFNDFVFTRDFARSVIEQTDLAPLLADPSTREVVLQQYWRAVRAFPTSNSFITIAVTMEDPDLAVQVVQASIISFQERLQSQLETQSEEATAFVSEAVTRTEADLNKARRDLATYLQAHPELARTDNSPTSAARDPNLGRLNFQLSQAESAYTAALGRYNSLQTQAATGLKGQQLSFNVVDEPERPLAPLRERRLSLIKLPAVGLVLGVMLSSGIAVLLILTNRTVLGPYDLEGALAIPLLGELPELRRRGRFWRRAPRDAVRLRIAAPGRIAPASGAGS
jgi:uncharacterized protein involved in exopolysaccharide biosynthesis